MLTSSGNMQQPPNYYYDPRLLSDPRQNFHHENYYRYPSGFTHHPVLPDYGSFPRTDFSFKVYFPASRQIEDSKIGD
uniref:Uncharacterized protein n=1 Tax=Magallana gigas TaxID=29159 RepID=K1PFP7_MAGGI